MFVLDKINLIFKPIYGSFGIILTVSVSRVYIYKREFVDISETISGKVKKKLKENVNFEYESLFGLLNWPANE